MKQKNLFENELTTRQKIILNYIKRYIAEHDGISPANHEIAQHYKINLSAAAGLVNMLVRKGAITKIPRQHRSIRLVDTTE